MAELCVLLVGTRKGAFVLEGTPDRRDWRLRGPLCEGWPVHDVTLDRETGAVYAAAGSPWYGPAVWRSDDLGETWTHSSEGLAYGEDGPRINTVWNVTPAHGALYAGVEPAGLFRSRDGGATWEHVEGLTRHPTRRQWQGGAGGLCLHSIVAHPRNPERMWVGISSVGTFETRDGGATWETRNRGVRADFHPERYPEFGQCVHKLVRAADETGELLYQQNHCGVYRSSDGGCQWDEITEGLPSQFGFPMATHPRDPKTAWTIPLNGAEQGRYMPEGAAAVWRTHDGGATWIRAGEGLPQRDAYVNVLREAMGTDTLDPVGVYFGTGNGQLYASADGGATWRLIVDNLPAIWSVEAAILP